MNEVFESIKKGLKEAINHAQELKELPAGWRWAQLAEICKPDRQIVSNSRPLEKSLQINVL